MGKITKEALLNMRDLITDMEPYLDYNENTVLCCDRLSKIMESLIFNDTTVVVAGQILHYKEDKEYEESMKLRKVKKEE